MPHRQPSVWRWLPGVSHHDPGHHCARTARPGLSSLCRIKTNSTSTDTTQKGHWIGSLAIVGVSSIALGHYGQRSYRHRSRSPQYVALRQTVAQLRQFVVLGFRVGGAHRAHPQSRSHTPSPGTFAGHERVSRPRNAETPALDHRTTAALMFPPPEDQDAVDSITRCSRRRRR